MRKPRKGGELQPPSMPLLCCLQRGKLKSKAEGLGISKIIMMRTPSIHHEATMQEASSAKQGGYERTIEVPVRRCTTSALQFEPRLPRSFWILDIATVSL